MLVGNDNSDNRLFVVYEAGKGPQQIRMNLPVLEDETFWMEAWLHSAKKDGTEGKELDHHAGLIIPCRGSSQ